MRRKIRKLGSLFLCGFITASLTTGCGQTDTIENTPNIEEVIETIEAVEDLTPETTVETEKDDTEAVAEENGSEDPEESNEITSSNIVNNGGHFVQVGDKIYFHVADAESLGNTALWAQFADQQSGRTVLFEYDPTTGEVKDIAYDFTSGGISVQGDVLYTLAYKDNLEQPDEPETALGSFSQKEGAKSTDFAGKYDKLLGAGLNDSFLAVLHYDYVDNKLAHQILIYKDDELQKTVDVDDFCDCVALGDNTIFYFSGESENGYHLKQMDATTGKSIDLGKLPSFDYTDWMGHIEEVIFDGTQVYFNYATYEGTGNFFSQGFFVQAKAGEANSIRYGDMPDCVVDGEPRAAMFSVEDGEMVICEGAPGSCEVKGDGILGFYDEKGEWIEVAEGWESVFFDEEGNYKGVELAEKVGDYIFLIYNENQRVPEDDIGWRYAYCRKYTNVYCISIKTGESERLVHQAAPWSD